MMTDAACGVLHLHRALGPASQLFWGTDGSTRPGSEHMLVVLS